MAEVVAAVTVAATVMDPVVLADGTSSHEDVVTTQTVLPQNPLDDSLISQIQLASLEFSVEKIVDSVIARDGSRYYQVKWFDTWIDEASLLTKCQHIVSSYWASVNQQLNQSAEVEMEETEVNCISESKVAVEVILDQVAEPVEETHVDRSTGDNLPNSGQVLRDIIITNKTLPALVDKMVCVTDDNKNINEEPRNDKNVINLQNIQEEIVDHAGSPKNNPTNKCEFCNKQLSSKKVLRRHVILKHLKNGRHQCPVCFRRFFSSHELGRHMPVHTNVKAHVCEICGKSYKQSGHLHRHLQIHTGEKKFECDICKRLFAQKTNLENHYSTHSEIKLFECKECDAKYKHKNSVYTHYKRCHSGKRDSVCIVCDAGFQSKRLLRKHIKDVHSSALYSCTQCPRKFMLQKYLNKHVNKHEKGDMKDEKGDFKDTEENVLEDISQNKCPLCSSTFKTKHHLKVHLTKHEDTEISCDKCTKTFKWRLSLLRHIRVEHIEKGDKSRVVTENGEENVFLDHPDLGTCSDETNDNARVYVTEEHGTQVLEEGCKDKTKSNDCKEQGFSGDLCDLNKTEEINKQPIVSVHEQVF